jgi:hypothetical protein
MLLRHRDIGHHTPEGEARMANNDMDRVVPLGQLDDFKVAEGDPDVRGWEVLASDGKKIGEVDELLVDTGAMKVRYLDVDVDQGMVAGGTDRHVLIPIGYARLDQDRDCVMVDALASADLGGVPSYDQGPLTRDFETSVRQSFTARGGTSAGMGAGTSAGMSAGMGAGTAQGMSTGMSAGSSTGMGAGTSTGMGVGSTGMGSGMMDTAGLDNTPGMVTGLGMAAAAGGLSDTGTTGMRTGASDLDDRGNRMGSTGASAGVMSSMDDGLRGGERMGAGSQGPAGGLDREESRGGGMGALNERADELGYDRDAVRMRGDASHSAGLAGSDYLHNADEDFYASDAFDDTAFYGSRRGGGTSGSADRGLGGGPTLGGGGGGINDLSRGTGGADQVDSLSGSGLQRGPREMPSADMGADEDETRRLAQDARELRREDHQNRDVGGGSL